MTAGYLSNSTKAELKATAEALVASGKGILAADEAVPAMGQRFAPIGVQNTVSLSKTFSFYDHHFVQPFINENFR